MRRDGGKLFKTSRSQTANARRLKSVRVRRTMAARVDAEHRGSRYGGRRALKMTDLKMTERTKNRAEQLTLQLPTAVKCSGCTGIALVRCGHSPFCVSCVDRIIAMNAGCPICRTVTLKGYSVCTSDYVTGCAGV